MAMKLLSKETIGFDNTTGEVHSHSIEHTIIKKVSQDNFIQVYLEDLSGLLGIENLVEFKVLLSLWKKANFNDENSENGNVVYLVKSVKEGIANDTGYSLSRINSTISTLTKKKLLVKKDRSVYWLNPKYFFKGYSKDRIKAVKTVIEYEIVDDKEIYSDNENRE